MKSIVFIASVFLLMSCTSNDISNSTDKLQSNEIVEVKKDEASLWKKSSKIDEFGDKSNGFTFSSEVEGEFSNSAKDNGKLCVRADIDSISTYLRFQEYCNSKVSFPNLKFIPIKIKLDDNNTVVKEMFCMDHLLIDTKGELLSLMKQNKNLKFLVDLGLIDRYSSSKYVFSLSSDGLFELMSI